MPSRQKVEIQLAELERWKSANDIRGLWTNAPLMVTATLDDGIGQGLALIRSTAETAGLRVEHLGLVVPPERIVASCLENHPALLGLTVLQFDSEENLAWIAKQLPPETLLVAGGPVFAFDPDLAGRCGVAFAAEDLAHFLDFLLDGNLHAPENR
jgi:methylmalonyl-CoA mutase cobalamin-binding subunit